MMTDTICALATASGGALGIIRVSGSQAFDAVSAICSVRCHDVAPNTVHFTRLVEHNAASQHYTTIDEALVTVFRAPHSYTGEDSVEISCHGSRYILNKVLELLIQNGCRMANPGEYTMRAYLNGKMDLSQAEAVADLIASTNQATHQMAMSQLRGGISTELFRLRDQLLKLTSLLELELDFSDHEDLEFANRTELLELAQKINKHITHLAKTFETGQALKQGIPVAIVGKTNVGKSTLLNALLKDDRAIVSDIHGTTRDTIEDTIDIQGITFRFIDTAGIRQTTDEVEQIGITRTYTAIDKARIVLWLLDESPTPDELQDIQQRCQDKTLLPIWNKSDLVPSCPLCCDSVTTPIPISAKYGIGLDDLRQQLVSAAPQLPDTDVIVTNARHYDALTRAHSHLQRVIEGIGATESSSAVANSTLYTLNSPLPTDLLSEDLRLTLDALAEITGGQITPNEVLGNIFSHFCVGK